MKELVRIRWIDMYNLNCVFTSHKTCINCISAFPTPRGQFPAAIQARRAPLSLRERFLTAKFLIIGVQYFSHVSQAAFAATPKTAHEIFLFRPKYIQVIIRVNFSVKPEGRLQLFRRKTRRVLDSSKLAECSIAPKP
jgi:hypothetical protein